MIINVVIVSGVARLFGETKQRARDVDIYKQIYLLLYRKKYVLLPFSSVENAIVDRVTRFLEFSTNPARIMINTKKKIFFFFKLTVENLELNSRAYFFIDLHSLTPMAKFQVSRFGKYPSDYCNYREFSRVFELSLAHERATSSSRKSS